MKRFLLAAAVIALITPQIVLAQPHDRNGKNNRQPASAQQHQNRRAQRPAGGGTRQTQVRTTRVTSTTAGGPAVRTRTTRIRNTTVASPTVRTRTTVTRTRTASALPVYRPGHRPSSFHRIQVRSFNYPRGYSYRRWRTGSILPRLFLSSLYFWTDWAALGLGPPPPGYVWVRYGPDLLLVNRYTGRIADVIYGAFY